MSLESIQKKSTKELKVRFNKIRQSLIHLERYTRDEDNAFKNKLKLGSVDNYSIKLSNE